jgi:hypothetical protein
LLAPRRLGIFLILITQVVGCRPAFQRPVGIASVNGTTTTPGAVHPELATLTGTVTAANASVGDLAKLVAFAFGPVGAAQMTELGHSGKIRPTGQFQIVDLAAGDYYLEIGHTWTTPGDQIDSNGKTFRGLDWPGPLTPSDRQANNGTHSSKILTVTVTAGGSVNVPPIAVSEPFDLTWDTSSARPKSGSKFHAGDAVEFNLPDKTGLHEYGVVVLAGSEAGKGPEAFSQRNGTGHMFWRDAKPGQYSYQASAYLVSSTAVTGPWVTFTINPN